METLKNKIDYYNALIVLSFQAIFNFIIGARNLGKTTAFKVRAVLRFEKRGKKTVWVRRFSKEKRKCVQKFYSKKIVSILNKKQKKRKYTIDDFKRVGDTWFLRVNGKFKPFLTVVALCESNSERSADDPDVDTIVFDEFTTTPENYARFRGNECTNFVDLCSSEKRINKIQIFLLGNKESYTNPYFNYFGIPLPELSFEGIRTYNDGSILLQVVNDLPDEVADSYENKWNKALKNTPYYGYLNDGKAKFDNDIKREKCPKNACLYCQIDFIGGVSLFTANGRIYAKTTVDKTKQIFVYNITGKYPKERAIRVGDRELFKGLILAYKYGLLFYSDPLAEELTFPFLRILGLK